MRFSSVKKTIYEFVSRIPKGHVVSYGFVAKKLRLPSAHLVGKALHENPDPGLIPCHRVVYADGSLSRNFAFGGEKVQRKLLSKEGIRFNHNRVDMAQLKNNTSNLP